MSRVMPHKTRGFSLVELMITVVIIGIIAAFAIPTYQEHARKTRRAECESVLIELAGRMERQYSVSGKYPTDIKASLGLNTDPKCPKDGNATFYTIGRSTPNGLTAEQAYTLTATPTGAQQGDKCDKLTLDNKGIKGAKGNTDKANVDACWR